MEEFFLPSDSLADRVQYVPHLMAITKVHFVDSRKGLSADEEVNWLLDVPIDAIDVDWSHAERMETQATDLARDPVDDARFAPIPKLLTKSRGLSECEKSLSNHLYRSRRFDLLRCPSLGEYSKPGESERDFRIRLTQAAREERDEMVEKMRKKYASKIRTLEDRVHRAEVAVEREQSEADRASRDSMISLGTSILSAVLGRKKLSSTNVGRASRTAKGFGRASKQAEDVRRAERKAEDYRDQLDALEAECRTEIETIRQELDPLNLELETIQLKPRRTDIDIRLLAILWVPA